MTDLKEKEIQKLLCKDLKTCRFEQLLTNLSSLTYKEYFSQQLK